MRRFVAYWVVLLLLGAPVKVSSVDKTTNMQKDETKVFRPAVPGVSSDSIIDPLVNWPVWTGLQQTGEINASFDCFGWVGVGAFGREPEVPGWPVVSFESPPGSGIEYLSWGIIWIGGIVGSDTLVSVGSSGWATGGELYPPGYRWGRPKGTVTRIQSHADYSMRALFTDTLNVGYRDWFYPRSHEPLNLRIANRSHVWRTPPATSTVLYDLVITNIGNEAISKGCLGLYFDGDIGINSDYLASQDDLAGSIRDHGIAYMTDNDGDPVGLELPDTLSPRRAFGFKYLATSFQPRDTCFNWWRSWGYTPGDFGPRMLGTDEYPFRDFGTGGIATPSGDGNKYYVMSKPEWDYDQVYTQFIGQSDPVWLNPGPSLAYELSHGADVMFLMSIGPFDLLPDSSIRVLYATFAPDSVIYRHDMQEILNLVPEHYTEVLDLSRLIEMGEVSDSLAQFLLDPTSPVSGLQMIHNSRDSLVIEWDPWVFNSVDGYELSFGLVPSEALPYPGVLPPWYQPNGAGNTVSTALVNRYAFDDLTNSRYYWFNVAHRSGGNVGGLDKPLIVLAGGRTSAPEMLGDYAFMTTDGPATFGWTEPDGMVIDHYNIYRFENAEEAIHKYHAFYDLGFRKAEIPARDSFFIDSLTYFCYSMTPHGQVPFSQNEYSEYSAEGVIYIVTAVDTLGFESEFSKEVLVQQIEPRTSDILVLTFSGEVENFVALDTLKNFYTSILVDYDWDLYSVYDTNRTVNCPGDSGSCVDWHVFTRYKLLIIDDGLLDAALLLPWENHTHGLVKYLLSGGKVAYFGALSSFNMLTINAPSNWYRVLGDVSSSIFGVDSIFYVGAGHFLNTAAPPYIDTSFAFSFAEGLGGNMPDVHFDPYRYPFTPDLPIYWPSSTPPSVAAFGVNDSATVTHWYRSFYPASSVVEGEPVGVKTEWSGTETYLFGFHLWYMDPLEARGLVSWISEGGSVPCCVGLTGNIDGSSDQTPDIADLTALIWHLYVSMEPLSCPEEANIDGDPAGIVDIGDLTALIDYLFLTLTPAAACP